MAVSKVSRAWVLVTLLALPAWAQDDDLLAPLPVKGNGATKAKAKPKAKPKGKIKPAPSISDDELAPLVPAKTELNVQLAVAVKGARLFIDDKEIGVMPSGPKTVAPGEHVVQIKRPGYATLTKRVNVAKGKSLDLNYTLEAVAGVLTVESDVPGADVWVNEKRVGVTPLRELEIPPGPAEVRVRKENYRDASEVLTVRPGRDYVLTLSPVAPAATVAAVADRPTGVDLTPRPTGSSDLALTEVRQGEPEPSSTPIYKRWYFWAGVAAVVAAGTTTAVLVTRPQPGSKLPSKNNVNDWCTDGSACYYWQLPSSGNMGSFEQVMRSN